jgi:hypothetical protein
MTHGEYDRPVEYEGPDVTKKHFAWGCFLLALVVVLLSTWLLIRF